MATKSFTTEYKFTSKSVPKLLKAIEMQENPMSPIKRKSNNKFIVTTNKKRIDAILESYK
ncbi:hypothetical protein [Staphylococcus pettenkoferi]|uniref:hypothetical protein n=1 Tax=Staphylococcus pettenkoferi TaxID=170573 RepID=UPI00059311C6|nr:hypothetical protein [Staphylococcus pettenkoferi]ASE37823.1 hypothetical protein CEP67_11235 [Staphylococcus pettenkoferi]MCY1580477.1 hypothetical protein [Staphylococcus pettenkoferi]MCY1619657.1 hypothetical protein [Staphylococcus pettenkoferi]MDK7115615.1 hypothetical protein [Staphylococcus pettenkoferi]